MINYYHTAGRQYSLRGRYLTVSALITMLIFTCAALTDYLVQQVTERSSANIEQRLQGAHQLRLLRDAIITLESDIEGFMLSPSPNRIDTTRLTLRDVDHYQHELGQSPWGKQPAVSGDIKTIGTQLNEMGPAIEQLIKRRADINRQFPLLTIMRDKVYLSGRAYLTGLQRLEQQISDEPQLSQDRITSSALSQLESSWDRTLNALYPYVLNRLGNFDTSRLSNDEHDIQTFYTANRSHLATLIKHLRNTGHYSKLSDKLTQITTAADSWYAGYNKMRALDDSGIETTNTPLMKNILYPMFDTLWGKIRFIESVMETNRGDDVNTITQLAHAVVNGLWALAFIGLFFVVIGYIYFERVVIKPIALIAGALKAEASGLRAVPMPRGRTLETQQLLDAFTTMRTQIKDRQRALEHQSLHDSLTGLANRLLLQDRLRQAIIRAHRDGTYVSLMLINLNQFKEVNDSLGHHAGDELLLRLCERLSELFDETATFARVGADEFAVLLPASGPTSTALIGADIQKSLRTPFKIGGQELFLGCAIGLAYYPNHAIDGQELLQRADIAMQHAKRRKSGLEEYDPSQDTDALRRFSIANELRLAFADHTQFSIAYQPQVAINTGRYFGAEALIRWEHPTRGKISPDEFITVAEQTGLIRPLTYLAVNRIMEQCASWISSGLNPGQIAFNLSVHNIEDPEFVEQLRVTLQRWEVPPQMFTVELTESSMMADPASALESLKKIGALGLQVAVDDFGTGFSSLAYLKRLPVNKLKIDRSFIANMHTDDNDAVIVRSTIDLSHNMGLKVVAEGVDNREVFDLLEILDCDYAQGYLLSKPLPPESLEDWMKGKVTQVLRPRVSFA